MTGWLERIKTTRVLSPVTAVLLLVAILIIWFGGVETFQLRETLKHVHFWSLEILLIGCVALTALNAPALLKVLKPDRQTLIALVFLALLSFWLSSSVAPRTNRIFYDEQIYLNVGQNLSDLKTAQVCVEGNVEYVRLDCNRGEYSKQPYGYPHLLSVLFRLFGTDEVIGHRLNNGISVLHTLLVFLITSLLFKDKRAGLLSALVFANIPQQALWSNTAAAEPTAAFAVSLAVFTAIWHCKEQNDKSLAWMVVTACLASQFRSESTLVIPLVCITIAMLNPRLFASAKHWWAAFVALILLTPIVAHLFAVRGEAWGAEPGEMFALHHFMANIRVNGLFYLTNDRFPAIFTIFALIGAILTRSRTVLIPIMYFVLFWGIFLTFYAGSYSYGADVRYSLMSYAPTAILAGVGCSYLISRLENSFPEVHWQYATVALICVISLSFLPLTRAISKEAWTAREDVAFAKETAPSLPPNSIVLTHNSNMFLVWGINAGPLHLVLSEPDYVKEHLSTRYAGGIFLHWNFWCSVDDAAQKQFCKDVFERFPNEVIAERKIRDKRYAFHRLDIDEPTSIRVFQAPQTRK